MADRPYTDAELEQAADVLRRAYEEARAHDQVAAEVMDAVLPDHDARVRADERARVAAEIAQDIARARDDRMVVTITDPAEMARAAVWRESARLARQHATPPTTEGDPNA